MLKKTRRLFQVKTQMRQDDKQQKQNYNGINLRFNMVNQSKKNIDSTLKRMSNSSSVQLLSNRCSNRQLMGEKGSNLTLRINNNNKQNNLENSFTKNLPSGVRLNSTRYLNSSKNIDNRKTMEIKNNESKNFIPTQQQVPTARILITNRQKRPVRRVRLKRSKSIRKNQIYVIIREQILKSEHELMQIFQTFAQITNIIQKLIEGIYSYDRMQIGFKKLNNVLKNTMSKLLIFQGYVLCSLCLFVYGSYSLAIFYFDKALKKFSEIQKCDIMERHRQKQIEIYKTVAKIFLIKGQYKLAKQFAYKYLRKAWYMKNIQEQLNAYDILGKIYHQFQIKKMSLYFHNRMCKCQRQQKQFIKLSNFQLQKHQKQKIQFAVYQTIHVFIQRDKLFHQMLEDRYKMRDRNYQDQQDQNIKKNNFFFHTHRSPNRNLNSYRILERKLIEERNSKQLHFIKPKQAPYLKKVLSDFLKFISKVRQQVEEQQEEIKKSKKILYPKQENRSSL